MESEQGPPASSPTCTSSSTSSSARPSGPQISVYSGIPDRQTVQVIQQALHRQPSTAAQYLQQMYAAQQQHLMLHTAALQQQHLSSAQLSSAQLSSAQLSSAQLQGLQASIAAGRPGSNQNGTSSPQTGSSQTTINLTTPPAAAQLISRAQSVSSAPTGVSQAVLLGSPSSPALTASQAQMYLRAQMAQQSNLVQVARSLGRAVPLSPQLIFTPTGTVTTPGALPKGAPGVPGGQGPGQKGSPAEASPEGGGKKGEGVGPEGRVVNMSRTPISTHPLITPAYAQIQLQKQQQGFVIQQPSHNAPRAQLLQTAPVLAPPPIPVLPKPAPPSQQATIFHSTLSPLLTPTLSPLLAPSLSQAKVQPVQLTAINLQIQPTPATAKHQHRPAGNTLQQTLSSGTRSCTKTPRARGSLRLLYGSQFARRGEARRGCTKRLSFGSGVAERNGSGPAAGSAPAMTSGNENNAPTVAGSAPQNGESRPPQAIVKPQVLTHVIEGFVIQEGAEPFPVERVPVLADGLKKATQQQSDLQKTPQNNPPHTPDSDMEDLTPLELRPQEVEEPKLQCEFCGWVDFAYNFKGTKRFCSTVCAKRYNVGCSKRIGLFHPDRTKTTSRWRRRARNSTRQNTEAKKQKRAAPPQAMGGPVSHPSQGESSPCSDISSFEGPPSPLSAASSQARGPPEQEGTPTRELPVLTHHFLPSDPPQWSVEEVHRFIRSLPGCLEIAEEFRSQEIDGQALLLLKEDHLMSTMNIKLGPALKIYAHIGLLKDS
ncbi:hypothetical protein COCON_G00172730 [Conger conger]|uniref:Polyhomeotic-like protein 2 n=1 Tax=Conger conger TaxID=82655 RepID=A0A9Q1D475_CONCO|nr:hypothetical protein COCON_G00172730 [Conger conger]